MTGDEDYYCDYKNITKAYKRKLARTIELSSKSDAELMALLRKGKGLIY
jgi:hypothetical protein